MTSLYTQPANDLMLAMMYQKANPYFTSPGGTSGDISSLEGKMNSRASQLNQRIDNLEKQVQNSTVSEPRIRKIEADVKALKDNPLIPPDIVNRLGQLERDLVRLLESSSSNTGVTDLKNRVTRLESASSEIDNRFRKKLEELRSKIDQSNTPQRSESSRKKNDDIESDLLNTINIQLHVLPEWQKSPTDNTIKQIQDRISTSLPTTVDGIKSTNILRNITSRLYDIPITSENGFMSKFKNFLNEINSPFSIKEMYTSIEEYFKRVLYFIITDNSIKLQTTDLYERINIPDSFMTEDEKKYIYIMYNNYMGITNPTTNADDFIKSNILYFIIMVKTRKQDAEERKIKNKIEE